MSIKSYSFIFLLFFLGSCTASISIDGFDREVWFNDRGGCKGGRKAIVELLESNKEKLLGKDQNQIKKLLGKPDMHELYKRTQRFYVYSVDPRASCANFDAGNTKANLTLRFNALGRVHEVVYYR